VGWGDGKKKGSSSHLTWTWLRHPYLCLIVTGVKVGNVFILFIYFFCGEVGIKYLKDGSNGTGLDADPNLFMHMRVAIRLLTAWDLDSNLVH